MNKAIVKRINKAFDKIYRKGDNGLEYMDGHFVLDTNLMQHFYNETLDTLPKAQLAKLAEQLETVVEDMNFDLV